jgi:hypothetical protein
MPEQPLVPPTIVVESSPGHRQLYFRLTRLVEPRHGAALNRRLAAVLGGDNSGWDLTQLLRIPGTHNTKYPERPLVRVVQESSVQYDPRELEGFLPQLPPTPPRRRDVTPAPEHQPRQGAPPIPLTRSARAIWNGQDVKYAADGRVDRSASLIRIARILSQAGLAPEHITQVLAERDAALGWRKFSDRDDSGEHYRRIADLVAHGPRPGEQSTREEAHEGAAGCWGGVMRRPPRVPFTDACALLPVDRADATGVDLTPRPLPCAGRG